MNIWSFLVSSIVSSLFYPCIVVYHVEYVQKFCMCPPKLKKIIIHVCLCPQPILQIFIILNSGNNSSSEGEELSTSAPCGARRQQDTYWRTLFRNRSIEEVHSFKPEEERSSSYSSVKGGKESRIAYIISISNHMQSGNKGLGSIISFLCTCPLFL
jgi:hypothetical protein